MEFSRPHDPTDVAAARNKRSIEDFVVELATPAGANEPANLARKSCLIIEEVCVTHQVPRAAHTIEVACRLAQLAINARLPDRAD